MVIVNLFSFVIQFVVQTLVIFSFFSNYKPTNINPNLITLAQVFLLVTINIILYFFFKKTMFVKARVFRKKISQKLI
jgi:hypothetical protein